MGTDSGFCAKHNAKFRPYGGSRGWAGGAMAPVEDDQDQWVMLAQSDETFDDVQAEAELRSKSIQYEWVDPYWHRSQVGQGLEFAAPSAEATLKECLSWELGFKPTKKALAGAAV